MSSGVSRNDLLGGTPSDSMGVSLGNGGSNSPPFPKTAPRRPQAVPGGGGGNPHPPRPSSGPPKKNTNPPPPPPAHGSGCRGAARSGLPFPSRRTPSTARRSGTDDLPFAFIDAVGSLRVGSRRL